MMRPALAVCALLLAAMVFGCGQSAPPPEPVEGPGASSLPVIRRAVARTVDEVFALALPRAAERLPMRAKLTRVADACVRRGILGPEAEPLTIEEMSLLLRPTTDRDGMTVLHLIARAKGARAEECIHFMAASGADLDQRDARGRTPLLHAAEYRLTEHALALLAEGAAVDLQDDLGRTALMHAVYNVKELIGPLLDAGADPTVTTYEQIDGWSRRGQGPISALELAIARRNRYALDMFGYEGDLYRSHDDPPPLTPPPPPSTEELLEAARKQYSGGGPR